MEKKIWVSGAAALACIGALVGTPASAYTSVGVQIGVPSPVYVAPPPPPRYERMPAPRRGQVWVPGHWEWQGNRHAWVHGQFLRARSGYHYQQPQWQQQGDRWAYRPGGWSRGDRDGDGVPNRYDRAPNNQNRR